MQSDLGWAGYPTLIYSLFTQNTFPSHLFPFKILSFWNLFLCLYFTLYSHVSLFRIHISFFSILHLFSEYFFLILFSSFFFNKRFFLRNLISLIFSLSQLSFFIHRLFCYFLFLILSFSSQLFFIFLPITFCFFFYLFSGFILSLFLTLYIWQNDDRIGQTISFLISIYFLGSIFYSFVRK